MSAKVGEPKTCHDIEAADVGESKYLREVDSLESALLLCSIGQDVGFAASEDEGSDITTENNAPTADKWLRVLTVEDRGTDKQQAGKRKDSLDVDNDAASTFDWKEGGLSPPAAMSPDIGRPFRWDFGKHRGRTIDETPRTYVDWAVNLHMDHDRPDLQQALLANGYEVRNDFDSHGLGFDENLWISLRHAREYFGVRSSHMITAGYSTNPNGNWLLVEVVSCALEIIGMDDGQVAEGVIHFLHHIRRYRSTGND